MRSTRSSKQPSAAVLGKVLKAAAIGIASSVIFGVAFRTGMGVEQQAGR